MRAKPASFVDLLLGRTVPKLALAATAAIAMIASPVMAQQSDAAETLAAFRFTQKECPVEFAFSEKARTEAAQIEMMWAYIPDQTKIKAEQKVKKDFEERFGNNTEKFCKAIGEMFIAEAAEKPDPALKITVLKAIPDRWSWHVLVAVDNSTSRHFEYTSLSCVLWYRGQPVHESSKTLRSVTPNGRTIQQLNIFTEEQADRVECRATN